MTSTQTVEGILGNIIQEEFGDDERIRSASVVSKTGLMVAGKPASTARAETFSAMAAIMFSAAETTRKDVIKEDLEQVMALYKGTVVLISELSATLLLVVLTDREVDQGSLLEKMSDVVARARSEVSWLG